MQFILDIMGKFQKFRGSQVVKEEKKGLKRI